MKLSNKRRLALYAGISKPVTQLRIELARGKDLAKDKAADEMDDRLCDLESQIWREVYKALNLEGPP